MAKTKISEFSATPANNTDIDSINIAEGCAPSGINDAIRELMAQLKDYQAGTAGDSVGAVGSVIVKGTSAAGANIQLYEDTDNGTNYVALKAPNLLAADVTWTLPNADGTANQVLKTDGAGNFGWATASTGDVTLTGTQTLTNKTITYADNTLTGVAGTTATQTLTNKTVEAGVFTNGYTEETVTANTGTATLNVNGLGAKTIVKGVSTTLVDGDIGGSMICTLVYNGTNFVLQNPTTNALGNMLNLVTTDVTYSSSTAENTLLSYSLPGNVLGTGNAVRVTLHVSALGTFTTSTATLRFKYGATTLVTKTIGGTATSSFSGKIEFILAAAGTASSQNGSISLNFGTDGYVGNGNTLPQYFAFSSQGTSSIDSTSSQTLAVTYQASNNSASDNITVSMIVVEKITA